MRSQSREAGKGVFARRALTMGDFLIVRESQSREAGKGVFAKYGGHPGLGVCCLVSIP